jgi:hypothetical protein
MKGADAIFTKTVAAAPSVKSYLGKQRSALKDRQTATLEDTNRRRQKNHAFAAKV